LMTVTALRRNKRWLGVGALLHGCHEAAFVCWKAARHVRCVCLHPVTSNRCLQAARDCCWGGAGRSGACFHHALMPSVHALQRRLCRLVQCAQSRRGRAVPWGGCWHGREGRPPHPLVAQLPLSCQRVDFGGRGRRRVRGGGVQRLHKDVRW
jgi:hypothetical protein